MSLISALRTALGSANCRAFLRVIRAGESSQDDVAYYTLFGGGTFQSMKDHPRIAIQSPWGWTSAAGAYQFMAAVPGKVKTDTWDGLVKQYGFLDFYPETQDLAAVALIKGRKALEDVLAGRLESAIRKCAKEWASLPFSPYGQPRKTLEQCKAVYLKYGGTLADQVTEAPVAAPIVIPVLSALLPEIVKLIPSLGSLFGSGSEVSNRNLAAAQAIGETLVQVTNSPNIQAAVEAISSDPEALQAAKAAVYEILPTLTEAGGGGIKAAREANLAEQPPFWKQPAFIFLIAVIPLVYMLAASVLFGLGKVEWTQDVRVMVATGFIGLLGAASAYFWGSSLGSAKKDQVIGGAK